VGKLIKTNSLDKIVLLDEKCYNIWYNKTVRFSKAYHLYPSVWI